MSKAQRGLAAKCCLSYLVETYTDYTSRDINGRYVDDILFDFVKVFLFPHIILAQIIRVFGVREEISKWFENFISGRKQILIYRFSEFKVNRCSQWSTSRVRKRVKTGMHIFLDIH